MSRRLRTARIRMRPPGATEWRTIATNLDGANAVAVGDVDISWNQPTPRDHPDPGAISFTLLVPDGSIDEAILAYDTEVLIDAELDEYAGAAGWLQKIEYYPVRNTWYPLGRGWLTSWSRSARRRPDGRSAYTITCIDILGRAAATNLAAEPWPASHTSSQRVAAINAASPSGPLLDPASSSITSEAYDVDNAPALDVIRRHCPIAVVLVETTTGLAPMARPNRNARYVNGELQFSTPGGDLGTRVQADMIEDTGRELDRTSVISEVSVTAYWGTETERREITWRDSGSAYSSSRHSVDTDERLDATILQPRVASWATRLMAESRAARRRLPAGHRLILGLPRINAGIDGLFLLGRRGKSTMLHIQSPPPDLDPLQFITGGRITITGKRLRLTLDTVPAGLFGMRPLRFADMPRDARRPRIKGTEQTMGGITWKTRITDTSAVSVAPWPNTYDWT